MFLEANTWRKCYASKVKKKYVFCNFSVFLWIHQGETWVAVGEAKKKMLKFYLKRIIFFKILGVKGNFSP